MNKTQQIRDLAKQVRSVAYSEDNILNRDGWMRFNDRRWTGRPPVLLSIDNFAFREILPADCQGAQDPVYNMAETQLRKMLWYASLDSDMVIEPWINMNASYHEDSIYMFGTEMQYSQIGRYATDFHGEIEKPEDVDKMQVAVPHMDGTRTLETYDRLQELLDGILDIRVEWRHRHLVQPNPGVWTPQFMGIKRFYEWCWTEPETVHKFMKIMTDSFIRHNLEMEKRGRLTDNHCFIPDFYAFHGTPIEHPKLKDLWVHSESQDFTGVSPGMLSEYLFAYIRPIFEMFGAGSFGCCESLNGKLDIVKTLPNLKRVTISEKTDWDYALDTLGDDYLLVVRPTLTDTIYADSDEQIEKSIKEMAHVFRNNQWELNFPGALSFNGDKLRFHRYVKTAKRVLEDVK